MTAICLMPTNGRSCRASARSIEPPSSESLPKRKSGDVSSVCELRPMTKTPPRPGPRLPRDAAAEPPLAGPLPERLELILGDQIYIAKDPLPPGLYNRLVRLAAFQNPEFYKAQAMRLSTYDKPRIIACAEDLPHHIGLPRGCLDEVRELLSDLRIDVVIRDERNAGKPLDVKFRGELYPEQAMAARDLLAHDTGVLAATTAFGKTVVAAWLIAERGGQYARSRASPAIAGTMGGAIIGVSGSASQSHRPNRRRAKKADGFAGRGDHPKPGAQERGE